jgi:hypothetical protein
MTLICRRAALCLKLSALMLLFAIEFISASSSAMTKIAITVDDLPIHGKRTI